MSLISGHLVLLVPLLVVTAAQAEPSEPPLHGLGSVVFTPAARPHFPNLDPPPSENHDPRSSRRYGIGYDARHGVDSEVQRHRDSRMDGIEHPQQYPSGAGSGAGRGAGAGRGGRGR